MYQIPAGATLKEIQALIDAMYKEPRDRFWHEKYKILCDRETELIKVRNAKERQ